MRKTIGKDWTRKELDHYLEGLTATTIATDIHVEGNHRVLDLSELEELLQNAEIISQQTCFCREKLGNCIEPMDGCLSLDKEAREMIDKGDAKEVSVKEALEALLRTYEAGLVHMAYEFEGQEGVGVICSCCSCCCHTLSAALRFGYKDHAFKSKLISRTDIDKCNDCGICVERCQFGAREMVEGTLIYNEQMCFGCGLCMTCPEDAIIMVER